jgi:hypothetical protein
MSTSTGASTLALTIALQALAPAPLPAVAGAAAVRKAAAAETHLPLRHLGSHSLTLLLLTTNQCRMTLYASYSKVNMSTFTSCFVSHNTHTRPLRRSTLWLRESSYPPNASTKNGRLTLNLTTSRLCFPPCCQRRPK